MSTDTLQIDRCTSEEFLVSHLPPITLNFLLPDGYPSSCPPEFSLVCSWLTTSQIEKLRQKLLQVWETYQGSEILFLWYSALRDDALETLGLEEDRRLDISEMVGAAVRKHNAAEKARFIKRLAAEKASSTHLSRFGDNNLIIIDEDDHEVVSGETLDLRSRPPVAAAGAASSSKPGPSSSAPPDQNFKFGGQIRRRRQQEEEESREFDLVKRAEDERKEEILARKRREERARSRRNRVDADGEELWDKEDKTSEEKGKKDPSKICSNGDVCNGSNAGSIVDRADKASSSADRGITNADKIVGNADSTTSLPDFEEMLALAKKANRRLQEKRKKVLTPNVSKADVCHGVVDTWIEERGYGFLRSSKDRRQRIFVHRTHLVGVQSLIVGDPVEYTVVKGPRGGREEATNVSLKPSSKDDLRTRSPDFVKPPRASKAEKKPSDEKPQQPKIRVDETYRVLVDQDGEIVTNTTPKVEPNPDKVTVVMPKVKTSEEARVKEVEKQQTYKEVFFMPEFVRKMREYNELEQEREFDQSQFNCGVCFQDKMGQDCMRFKGCRHIYCRDCLGRYFEVLIKDGAVNNLTCPFEKCTTQALPHQVKQLVPAHLYSRYDAQLLETTLTTMADVLLCPRRHCQVPVLIDRDNSMAHCPNPACLFVFCIYCKATYHGVQPCRIKSKEQQALVKEYMSAIPSAKALLEKRYGKKQLSLMTEEYLSETFKEENSKRCPQCSAPIQKTEGCNKMTCNKCGTHFCYLCGVKVPKDQPYAHFNNPSGGCYQKLFEGVDIDDEDLGDWWPELGEDELEDDEDFVIF